MVLLSCSGAGDGIYAKLANAAAGHNCPYRRPAANSGSGLHYGKLSVHCAARKLSNIDPRSGRRRRNDHLDARNNFLCPFLHSRHATTAARSACNYVREPGRVYGSSGSTVNGMISARGGAPGVFRLISGAPRTVTPLLSITIDELPAIRTIFVVPCSWIVSARITHF